MEEKNKKLIIVCSTILVVAALVIGAAVGLKIREKRDKNFREYLDFMIKYCDKNYPDRYYLDSDNDILYVHLWEPGTALYLDTRPILADEEVKHKYESLSKKMYDYMLDMDLDYGVTLVLHNDINTERILMIFVNGEYQRGD